MMKFDWIFLFILLQFSCNSHFTQEDKGEISVAMNKVELGKQLFFDPILSQDRSISCSSCHQPKFAFADNKAFSEGVGGKLGKRNAPSVMNMASRPYFFHDGRALSLEEQSIGPIEDPLEMNLDFEKAIRRIQKQKHYQLAFYQLYNESPNGSNIPDALAEFQMSLESDGSAPHDKWMNGEDENALSPSAQRGRDLFLSEENKCFECHFGPDFTSDEFRNIGLYDGKLRNDSGRYVISRKAEDLGKFKVPGLRNVALTAPYMHDGSIETLEEVIDYYSNPYEFVSSPINIDSLLLRPLHFSDQEKKDLLAFLYSLTDEQIPYQ